MKSSVVGLMAGILLGIVAAIGGFWAFLLALVLGVIGYLLGAHRDGDVDLSALMGRGRG